MEGDRKAAEKSKEKVNLDEAKDKIDRDGDISGIWTPMYRLPECPASFCHSGK